MIRLISIVALFSATSLMATEPEVTPGKGSIVFYRGSSIMGAAIACPIRHAGNDLVELGRGKFYKWQVAPGRYILTNKTSSVEVTVEAGETRYVRCMIKTGFLSGRADLQVVDNASFADARQDLVEKTGAD